MTQSVIKAAGDVPAGSSPLPYELADPAGHRAALGVVVLKTDETLEIDLRRLIPETDIALHVTRIPMATGVDLASLAEMEASISTVSSLLPSRAFDVVGYGCTSGASVIGPETVARGIRQGCTARRVTSPIEAAIAACQALGLCRIGLLTPYVAEVSAALQSQFEAAEIQIAAFGSFEEGNDTSVARIAPRAVLEGACEVGARDCDGVFLSCTNLQTLSVIPQAEARLGKPVISSNLALGWHMRALAGLGPGPAPIGRLMSAPAGTAPLDSA